MQSGDRVLGVGQLDRVEIDSMLPDVVAEALETVADIGLDRLTDKESIHQLAQPGRQGVCHRKLDDRAFFFAIVKAQRAAIVQATFRFPGNHLVGNHGVGAGNPIKCKPARV